MAKYTGVNTAAIAISESIGLDPKDVKSLEISFGVDAAVMVTAEVFVNNLTMDVLEAEIKQMRFVQEDIGEADNG